MSHFKVLCLTNSSSMSELEDLMAPYQENNCGDCPDEYLEFEDRTEELLEEFKEEKVKYFVNEDGERMYLNDLPVYRRYEVQQSDSIEVITDLISNIINFEQFCERRGYAKEEINGEKRYGYYYNPNSRWDYWGVTNPSKMGVFGKDEEYIQSFPTKISQVALDTSELPRQAYKFKRVWEQIIENDELEYGEPEVTVEEYPKVRWYNNKNEYILHETLGVLYNIYSVVTPDGWDDEMSDGDIKKMLEENPDKYVWIVDCHT